MMETSNYIPEAVSGWISQIDSWLSAKRPAYYSQLLPGLTQPELQELEAAIGYKLPESFCQFLSWRNGQVDREVGTFIGNRFLLNAADIVREVNYWRDNRGDHEPGWFHDAWIPFMGNYQSDFSCLDMEGSFEGQVGQLLEFIHDDDMRVIKYTCFEKWLETFAFAMTNDLLRLFPADTDTDTDDVFETVEFRQAYERINPGMPIYVEVENDGQNS